MPTFSPSQLLFIARQHFDAGRLAEAQGLCRQIIRGEPRCAAALHLSAILAERQGQLDVAAAFLQRACDAEPGNAGFRGELGRVLARTGKLDEAIMAYRASLALEPGGFEAMRGLGGALLDGGQVHEGLEVISAALALRPESGDLLVRLGDALRAMGLPGNFPARGDANAGPEVRKRPGSAGNETEYFGVSQDEPLNDPALTGASDFAGSAPRTGSPDDVDMGANPSGHPFSGPACGAFSASADPNLIAPHVPACAVDAYRAALRIIPDDPAIHLKLGDVLAQLGLLDEAQAEFLAACRLRSDFPEALLRLGHLQYRANQLHESRESFLRAIALDPNLTEARVRLGNVLLAMNEIDAAAESFHRAITLKPADAGVYDQIGDGAADPARIDDAISRCSALLTQRANDPGVCINAASAFQRRRYLDAAIAAYRRALDLEPGQAVALNNLSLALKDAGRLDEAIACSRAAVELHPHIPTCHGNLLYSLHFHPESDAEGLLEEHRRWSARHADPLLPANPQFAARDASRRLRIGYVSPNFNGHPIGRFMSALLAHHDRSQFEIVCYSSLRHPDALTEKLRQRVDRWNDVAHLSDAALAERIRGDGIDILVDLTMHMEGSRLLAFARRPAPVQVTYLAYCSTTGLAAMDYRLTDPWLDPPGEERKVYAEQSVHLPGSYWCYDPCIEAPDVNALPARANGYVTFAGLNNFAKASPAALKLWAKLLRGVPNSRLMLHAFRGSHRDDVRTLFAGEGIAPDRLEFFDLLPLPDYFALHHRIDLALDSFPYPGGTTTCDALWMGVPTVSLYGQSAFTRSGLTILTNAGLPELAMGSPEEYLQTAIALAVNLSRLAELRAGLRSQLKNSPLMDGPRFAREVEAIYRRMWQKYLP